MSTKQNMTIRLHESLLLIHTATSQDDVSTGKKNKQNTSSCFFLKYILFSQKSKSHVNTRHIYHLPEGERKSMHSTDNIPEAKLENT